MLRIIINYVKLLAGESLMKSRRRLELIIQKSVELGVNAIIPVNMKRCVVKIEAKDENKKIIECDQNEFSEEEMKSICEAMKLQ